MTFKDHFSKQSQGYARARPEYPAALFASLAALPAERGLAWDCGTGSGQAAVPLAGWFERVLATDASLAQVGKAKRAARVLYAVAPAERVPLRDGSADLVTVAQALHWFDFARFFAEVRRVARPGAVFAAWTYGLSRVSAAVDAVYMRFYNDVVGAFWPPERRHVEEGYRSIPMPFAPVATPEFAIEVRWDLGAYMDYLGTWSASQRYKEATGVDPVGLVREEFARAWGEGEVKVVVFPLSLLVGRVR